MRVYEFIEGFRKSFPDIKITIPLDSGGVLLCFWIGWTFLDESGIVYYIGTDAIKEIMLLLGVLMLILNNVKRGDPSP